MSFSGENFKYRHGNKLYHCDLYTSTADRRASTDVCLPITVNNKTLYLIAVHPNNNSLYLLSHIKKVINSQTYTIARSRIFSKTLNFSISGGKNTELVTMLKTFYNKLKQAAANGGHSNVVVRPISTGTSITFKNLHRAYMDYYAMYSSGGNGGKGGSGEYKTSGNLTVIHGGAGGGGGEAGELKASSANTTFTKAYYEFLHSFGSLRLRAWNGSTKVINQTVRFGANGGHALKDKIGKGGTGNTSGADGRNGSSGGDNRVGAGGAGGIINSTSYGRGGRGGNGTKSTSGSGQGGSKGSGWYFRAQIKYSHYG